jgi:hypothetical protein
MNGEMSDAFFDRKTLPVESKAMKRWLNKSDHHRSELWNNINLCSEEIAGTYIVFFNVILLLSPNICLIHTQSRACGIGIRKYFLKTRKARCFFKRQAVLFDFFREICREGCPVKGAKACQPVNHQTFDCGMLL